MRAIITFVKVCILSFNHPEITARAVKSALQFFHAVDIYLVHNGSRIENVDQLKLEYPDIRHLEILFNKGFTGGANFGLSETFKADEWVLFLTNDCELLAAPETRDLSSNQLQVPYLYFKHGAKVDSMGANVFLNKAKLWHCKSPSEMKEDSSIGKFVYAPGAAFLMHRNFFQTVGGFDEQLHTYWEDVDLSLRAKKMGMSLRLEPTFRVHHAGGKTCKKDSFYTNYLYQKNKRIVCRRWSVHFLKPLDKLRLEFSLLVDTFAVTVRWLLRGKLKELGIFWKAVLESYF